MMLGFVTTVSAQDDDRGFLTRKLEEALGGAGRDVRIEGFRGVLTSQASFDSLTIADDQGTWLTLTDVVLDWNRSALLLGRVEVNTLSAKSLDLSRLPESQPDPTEIPSAEATAFALPDLPVSIEINSFKVDQIKLGAPLLGEAVELKIDASANLADGTLDTDIKAERTDQKLGKFVIQASFDQSTEALNVNLDLQEEPEGIAAKLLNLPGHPEIDLKVNGTGTLSDFVAQIALASQGEARLTGQVQLLAEPVAEEIVEQDPNPPPKPLRQIRANIGGDIATLLAPEYQPFFGDNIALKVDVTMVDDGSLNVNEFSLNAEQAKLKGTVRLNKTLWPEFLDVDATIGRQDRAPILLPIGGPQTHISGVDLSVQYDVSAGEALHGVFDLQGLNREGIDLEQARVKMDGTLQGYVGSVGQLLVDIDATTQGLKFANPDLNAAIGDALSLSTNLNYIAGQPVRLSDLIARGADYGLNGWVIIGAPGGGMNTRLDVTLKAQDLSRFSGLAGRNLGGETNARISGSVAPLSGTFDLEILGTGIDLIAGQEQADALLQGTTNLDLAASRTTQGMEVKRLNITNPALQVHGDASLQTGNSTVNFDAELRDVAVLHPDYSGAARATGKATEDAKGWSVDLSALGPLNSDAKLVGRVTGPEASVDFEANLANVGAFVPEINGPLFAKGNVNKADQGWNVDFRATGPAGATAGVKGTVSDTGNLDVVAKGDAPLALTAPFLKPRILRGLLSYNIAVRGAPALSSLSGEISTTDAQFSAPNVRIALNNIASKVQLENGTAKLNVTGDLQTGGKLSVSGPVQLSGGFNSDLNIKLEGAVLVDPSLYRTTLNGDISISGPLNGGAKIGGRIDIGETTIKVPETGANLVGDIPDIRHIDAPPSVTVTRERAGLVIDPAAEAAKTGVGPVYLLDILVSAPAKIFVRGRGLDAELGGKVRLTGTSNAVVTAGRFDLIRGRMDILTKRFTLDEGNIEMQGSLLPYIHFETSTQTTDFTAKIILDGPIDDPTVSFSSVPEVPEDEVLAQILFGQSVADMSAFQALRLASAVATLAGKGGVGMIEKLRSGFGLDNLDVVTNSDGTTEVKVGKYLTDKVYTDISAGSDGGSEVSLNIDLTNNLKGQASVDNEGNSAVGVFFERDY
jgi:translocation and assembly module TamB